VLFVVVVCAKKMRNRRPKKKKKREKIFIIFTREGEKTKNESHNKGRREKLYAQSLFVFSLTEEEEEEDKEDKEDKEEWRSSTTRASIRFIT
jgi:uncharacterized Fe-S cluster-containing MiaB family protein